MNRPENSIDEDDTIDLGQYVRPMRPRWRLAVLAVILGRAMKCEHAAREPLLEHDRVVIPTVGADRQPRTRC